MNIFEIASFPRGGEGRRQDVIYDGSSCLTMCNKDYSLWELCGRNEWTQKSPYKDIYLSKLHTYIHTYIHRYIHTIPYTDMLHACMHTYISTYVQYHTLICNIQRYILRLNLLIFVWVVRSSVTILEITIWSKWMDSYIGHRRRGSNMNPRDAPPLKSDLEIVSSSLFKLSDPPQPYWT